MLYFFKASLNIYLFWPELLTAGFKIAGFITIFPRQEAIYPPPVCNWCLIVLMFEPWIVYWIDTDQRDQAHCPTLHF